MLVVVDAGNYSTKYFFGENKVRCFSSVAHDYEPIEEDVMITESKEMNRIQCFGLDKWIGRDAKDFFAFKKEQSVYTGNVRKGHYDALLRVVLSLYKIYEETQENKFDLVVMSPVLSRKIDKKYFEEALIETQSAVVDGTAFNFVVNNLKIATEGLGAKRFIDHENCIVIDAGSQTTNILKFLGGRFVSSYPTTTINAGTKNTSSLSLADAISKKLNMVDFDIPIRTTGGMATEIAKQMEAAGFPNCLPTKAPCDSFFINGLGVYLMVKEKLDGC